MTKPNDNRREERHETKPHVRNVKHNPMLKAAKKVKAKKKKKMEKKH